MQTTRHASQWRECLDPDCLIKFCLLCSGNSAKPSSHSRATRGFYTYALSGVHGSCDKTVALTPWMDMDVAHAKFLHCHTHVFTQHCLWFASCKRLHLQKRLVTVTTVPEKGNYTATGKATLLHAAYHYFSDSYSPNYTQGITHSEVLTTVHMYVLCSSVSRDISTTETSTVCVWLALQWEPCTAVIRAHGSLACRESALRRATHSTRAQRAYPAV